MHAIYLYGREGCHLCDDARVILAGVLDERAGAGLAVPEVIERDIDTDPDWQRWFMTTIPVLEVDGGRLELAVNRGPIRRFLAEHLG
jgi:hypothetical protein